MSLIWHCNPCSFTTIDTLWKCPFWQFYVHNCWVYVCDWWCIFSLLELFSQYVLIYKLKAIRCLGWAPAVIADSLNDWGNGLSGHSVIFFLKEFNIYWTVHKWTIKDYSQLVQQQWHDVKVGNRLKCGKIHTFMSFSSKTGNLIDKEIPEVHVCGCIQVETDKHWITFASLIHAAFEHKTQSGRENVLR